MHVLILGAGVVGVSSAYYLARQGHDVTLVDRAADPAAGTSYANGGQLAYSFVDALAQPSLLSEIPGLLLGRDPAMHVQLFARPSLVAWGLSFLGQCTQKRARNNTLAVLDLAQRSAKCLADLRQSTGIQFAHQRVGKVMLLPAGSNLAAAEESIELKRAHGCDSSLLSIDNVRERFPELQHFPLPYAGALYAPGDEVGDARIFAHELTCWLEQNRGLEWQGGVTVDELDVRRGVVRGVKSSAGDIAADAVLVCLGVESCKVLRPVGVAAPIYPLRGYSVTLPAGPATPSVSVTDMQRRIVFSKMNGHVRIAGLADFVGDDHARDASRIKSLLETARAIAPDYAEYRAADSAPWAGDRPMTPNSRPLVGATKVAGLYLNCGHGMLGWTLAAATGKQAAAAITRGH